MIGQFLTFVDLHPGNNSSDPPPRRWGWLLPGASLHPSPLSGFESRTVYPAASHYTNYSSPDPKLECVINQSFLCLRYPLHVRSTVGSPETSLFCTISTWCDRQNKQFEGYRLCRSQKSLSKRASSKNFWTNCMLQLQMVWSKKRRSANDGCKRCLTRQRGTSLAVWTRKRPLAWSRN